MFKQKYVNLFLAEDPLGVPNRVVPSSSLLEIINLMDFYSTRDRLNAKKEKGETEDQREVGNGICSFGPLTICYSLTLAKWLVMCCVACVSYYQCPGFQHAHSNHQ